MHQKKVYTIGHSTRPIEEFIEMLKANNIEALVDVRTIPKSRHNPQFGDDALKESLEKEGIEYFYIKKLGGLRKAKKDSINTGWRNASFRGYADYMATPEFAAGLEELEKTASEKTVAIMCAEAVPWRCHRSLVADALVARGWDVFHIMSKTIANPHTLTKFLQIKNGNLTYPEA
jgi:uncharacterized protein (DUF488 family)